MAAFNLGETPQTLSISIDDLLGISASNVAILHSPKATLVFSIYLASEIVKPVAFSSARAIELSIRHLSINASILCAYMHSSTTVCGHHWYAQGQNIAMQYCDGDDVQVDGKTSLLPSWYRRLPKSYHDDYVLSCMDTFLGFDLLDQIGMMPTVDIFALG